jgi:excisionase family DNA binding protein
MPEMSIQEAAKHYGLNRSTIYKAMGDGRLSFTQLPNGRRSLQPAEVERVFPPNRPIVSKQHPGQQIDTEESVNRWEENARLLQDTIRRLEADKEDLRQRLDRAEEERRQMTRLLEYHQRPWWQR